MANATYVSVRGKSATPSGRVSFPNVFDTDERGKYSLMLVFEREDTKSEEFKNLVEALNEAAKERFEVDSYKDEYKGKILNSPFKTSEHYDFLEDGQVAIRLKSKFKPQVIDADAATYLTEDNEFYAGCIARATYTVAAYDQDGNRGVSIQLNNIQKTGVGSRYSGARKDAKDEFGAVAIDTSVKDMPEDELAF